MSSLDQTVATFAARQHGVFAASQVPEVAAGMAHRRTTAGRWRAAHRGVYVIEGTPATWEQRLWIELLVAGAGSVVGTRAAAALHGFPGADRRSLDVLQPECTVPNTKARTSRRTTRLPDRHVTTVEGFPVTTPERTLFDLAALTSPQRRRRGWAHLHARQVERMVDDALARDLVSTQSLTDVYRSLAGRGRAGTRLMRQWLEERGEGYVATESALEDKFVELLKAHGLPQPRRQVELGSAEAFIGRVDFFFDEARLVVEADGRRYHSQRTPTLADRERELKLLAEGWQLLRVDWVQLVDHGPAVARHLRQILDRRHSS